MNETKCSDLRNEYGSVECYFLERPKNTYLGGRRYACRCKKIPFDRYTLENYRKEERSYDEKQITYAEGLTPLGLWATPGGNYK